MLKISSLSRRGGEITRWAQFSGNMAIILAITSCQMAQRLNEVSSQWLKGTLRIRYHGGTLKHIMTWWITKLHGGAIGGTNDRQMLWWNTRWQVGAPGEFLEKQIARWTTKWHRGQLWNGCAISGTINKLCYCSAQRNTTTTSPGDLMAQMHGGKVNGRYEVQIAFETRSPIKVLFWS